MDFDALVKDYLTRRKISASVQSDFGVVAGRTPAMGECIVIPVLTEGGVFSYNKYRRSPLSDVGPKYLYDKGGSMQLYGAWKARHEGRVLWCEGELDALVAWSVNIPAVSSTGGAGSIDPMWAKFFEGKDVVVCFDNDRAGGEGMVKALLLVPNARVLFLPRGIKDVSEYVERGGDLPELLKSAKRLGDYGAVIEDMKHREAGFLETHFHEAYVRIHAQMARDAEKKLRPAPVRTDGDAVARARQFPIDKMIDFDSRGMARCLWHNEKEGSLHWYKDDNHLYCFGGCGRAFDAIDVYRKLHDVGFKDAVAKLQ